MRSSPVVALLAATVLALSTACLESGLTTFAEPGERGVLCGFSIDHGTAGVGDLELGLDEAMRTDTIVQLYGHAPGDTVLTRRVDALLAASVDRGMGFVTYRDMAAGTAAGGSLALSFDDAYVDQWHALRPMFQRYGARVTFFVAHFLDIGPEQRTKLHELAADGHAIEYHGTEHRHAVDYVDDNGIDAYVRDEIEPALTAMRDDGFDPITFAYPYGEHSDELDDRLLEQFPIVRAIGSSCY